MTRPHRRASASTSANTMSVIGPGWALDDDVFVVSGHMRQRRLQRLVSSTCTAIGRSGENRSVPPSRVTRGALIGVNHSGDGVEVWCRADVLDPAANQPLPRPRFA